MIGIQPIVENGRRPLGVTLLAIVALAIGVVNAVLGLLHVATGLVVGIMDFPRPGGSGLLGGLAMMVVGAVYFVVGLGLWNLRPWAWWLGVLASVVGFVVALGSPVWMIVWAALAVYLILMRGKFNVSLPSLSAPNL